MEKTNLKINILPNLYLSDDGKFNTESALNFSGKVAGICYDKEGFNHLINEPVDKTNRRIDMTLNNGHHSVYDHVNISFNMQNIPKIMAMIINNEHEYTTSEKSARYTPVVRGESSIITEREELLYNKWVELLKPIIKSKYGYIYNDSKINKLAQENARYLVTVFMPTQMVYTTSLRQINYIASWMDKYIKENSNATDEFNVKLISSMKEFINELDRLNILIPGLLKNEKERSLSLFGSNLSNIREQFGNAYNIIYTGSFAELAQAQRHRTIDYKMEMSKDKSYFIPPIISDDQMLVDEWLNDINSVSHINPQGELILINELGKYDDFILKCKERLCSAAQLEIMRQTRDNLLRYKNALEENGDPLALDIASYCHGARCTFPDFTCNSNCGFNEGKTLTRKI